MIKLRGVDKYFNKGKKNQIHVINDTTVNLGTSGLVALLGPSGSGKTTLLNAIGGLDKVNKGDIFVDGQKITGRGASKVDKIRNLNIGYIFQDYKLVDNMTVYENVAMALKMIGIKDPEEIKTRITYILETLNIYRYRNRLCGMLSGGERQRVGIARAIAKNPKIIIADEPTGNLDSANTIEIMNIIKAISRDRLVVLVTHEVELAKFYASRIIELKDGKIEKDYENITDDNLNYRLDHKFYLKDFDKSESVSGDAVNVNFYGAADDKLDIDVVVKNGNIYIKTKNNQRVEVVDDHSNIEFVDDHFKEIDKTLYEDYKFEFDKVVNKNIKEKYSSVIGFFPSLLYGFKKVMAYPLMKKLLLIGFILAGLFITYSMSSIYASLDVQDKDFINANKEYITVEIPKVEVDKYLEFEEMPEVEYILPGKGSATMTIKLDFYYQSTWAQADFTGSLTDISKISKEDLIHGRMPQNPYEIVIDDFVAQKMFDYGTTKQVGITESDQLIGLEAHMPNMKPFTIVGITDKVQPLIYVDPEMFIDMSYNQNEDYYEEDGLTKEIFNYETVPGEFTLKSGTLPDEPYETLISYDYRYSYGIGKELNDVKVNGHKLKVVGYYESSEIYDVYLVNQDTIKYSIISEAKNFTICPVDMDEALTALTEDKNLNAQSTYEKARQEYVDNKMEMAKSTIVLGAIMLAISLVEILLMTRSSFLSRIKEIGIFRAIGVKKLDIYKMFLGEILAITTISSLPGILIMSYALSKLSKISYLGTMFAMNPVVFFGAIIIIYAFNAIVGLIPVFNTMRKTPAAILARYDVD